MGFFDKVKNMFTEEVEDDVKVEQIKNEVTHVSIETPKMDRYDIEEELELEEEKEELAKPIFFDDNDFRDLNLIEEKEEPKYIEKDIYGRKMESKPVEKKVFKPTPIISPVYGVLDKNYHKEDIVTRKPDKAIEDLEPTIDRIRNKAYGTLEEELENTLFGNNSILFKQIKEEKEDLVEIEKLDDDVLTNLTDDISKELDELLTRKEKYLDVVVEKEEVTDDLLDFIDSTLYKDGDEE